MSYCVLIISSAYNNMQSKYVKMFPRWGKRIDRLCSFWKCHNVVHTAGTIRKTACHIPHKIFISEWILSSSRITGEIKFKCFRHVFSEWDFRTRPETVAHHFTMSEANSRCRNKRCHYIAISPISHICVNVILYIIFTGGWRWFIIL